MWQAIVFLRTPGPAGAQGPHALIRRLGKVYKSSFDFHISILGPGMALSISRLDPEQGSLELMNIILITPINPTDCQIRVVSAVKRSFSGPLSAGPDRLYSCCIDIQVFLFSKVRLCGGKRADRGAAAHPGVI